MGTGPFVRVDNRLVHGQVLEAWLPALEARELWVADDQAAADDLTRAAMGMAIPDGVRFELGTLREAGERLRGSGPRALVLVRDVAGAAVLRELWGALPRLNLGNLHFGPGRKMVTPSLSLTSAELHTLEQLAASGTAIDARAVPTERSLGLPELAARFRA